MAPEAPTSTRLRIALIVACVVAALLPSLEAALAASALVSAAAFTASVRCNRGRNLPASLRGIEAAAGLFAVGVGVRVIEGYLAGDAVYPGVADLFILPAYLVSVWAVAKAGMARHALAKGADVLDAAVVAVGALTLSFGLGVDYLFAASTPDLERVVSTGYSIAQLAFLAVVALLMFGPGTRTAANKFLAVTGVYLAIYEGIYDVLLEAGRADVVDNLYRTVAVPMVTYALATSYRDYPTFAAPGVRVQTYRSGIYVAVTAATSLYAIVSPSTISIAGLAAVASVLTARLWVSSVLATRLQNLAEAQRDMATALAEADSTDQALEATLAACVRVLPSGADTSVSFHPDTEDSTQHGSITTGAMISSGDRSIRVCTSAAARPHHYAAVTQILDVAALAVEAVEVRTERITQAVTADWAALSAAGHEMVFRTRDGLVVANTPNAEAILGTDPNGLLLDDLLGQDLSELYNDHDDEIVFASGDAWMAISAQPADAGTWVVTVRDATARVLAERTDPVTRLPNMADFATHAEVTNTTFIWYRIEGFNRLNDQLGKLGADQLLVSIADRLRSLVRDGIDTVWRGDGPAFVVGCAGAEQPAALIQARAEAIAEPIIIGDTPVSLTVTTTVVPVAETSTVSQIVHRADLTSNEPTATPGSVNVFHPDLEATAQRRYRLEEALLAVRSPADSGFRVHYQPILDAKTLHATRLEALLRWDHPILGRVSPAEFIPAAERIGRAQLLDQFVMETAVADRERFAQIRSDIEVQINLSPVGLTPERVREITAWIKANCPNPPALTIEIIESVIGEDRLDDLLEALAEFTETGAGLSVDDFGVGESNLHRVLSMPITQVKLAGLFSTDDTIHPGTISRLVDTIHSMGHKVVVESVETEDQAAMMRTAGADYLQGWLYSRDLPADQLAEFLARGHKPQT